jgi:hypothetical protein
MVPGTASRSPQFIGDLSTTSAQATASTRFSQHRFHVLNDGPLEMAQESLQWSLAEVPMPALQLVPASRIAQEFGQQRTLSAIYKHDRIAILHPVPKKMVNVEEFERNQFLADSLKSYYESRCQVCGKDFLPEYGVAFSETHHIQYLARGGPDVSGNIVVLCPNHHRIVHATDARFNRKNLTYEYPNGLREPLIRPDHFVNAPQISAP